MPASLRMSSVIASSALALMLAACGGAPETRDNAALAPADAGNAATPETTSEEAAASVGNTAAAPDTADTVANVAAPAPSPTPSASPSPAATPEAPAADAGPAGNAANGEKLFAQCRICHSVEPGRNGLGPSLHDIVGRPAAQVAGFNFSPAMKNSGLTWDAATLSDYLRAPMRKVPGTKMAYAGMANDQNRADLIAYLATLK